MKQVIFTFEVPTSLTNLCKGFSKEKSEALITYLYNNKNIKLPHGMNVFVSKNYGNIVLLYKAIEINPINFKIVLSFTINLNDTIINIPINTIIDTLCSESDFINRIVICFTNTCEKLTSEINLYHPQIEEDFDNEPENIGPHKFCIELMDRPNIPKELTGFKSDLTQFKVFPEIDLNEIFKEFKIIGDD